MSIENRQRKLISTFVGVVSTGVTIMLFLRPLVVEKVVRVCEQQHPSVCWSSKYVTYWYLKAAVGGQHSASDSNCMGEVDEEWLEGTLLGRSVCFVTACVHERAKIAENVIAPVFSSKEACFLTMRGVPKIYECLGRPSRQVRYPHISGVLYQKRFGLRFLSVVSHRRCILVLLVEDSHPLVRMCLRNFAACTTCTGLRVWMVPFLCDVKNCSRWKMTSPDHRSVLLRLNHSGMPYSRSFH